MPRTIVLTGEPKSTQHLYKFSTRPVPTMYMTAEGKAQKEAYAWEAKSQWRDKPLADTICTYTARFTLVRAASAT